MQKGKAVIFVDALGKEHSALVTALNVAHEGYVSLIYIDAGAPEADNIKTASDVPHISDASRADSNPDLPSYPLNAWKEPGEEHRALPADHPQFDHPFKQPELDEQGNPIPVARPAYEADVAAHQDVATLLQQAPPAEEGEAQ